MKRKTIAQLEKELADARQTCDQNYTNGRKWREQADESEKSLKEVRSHFADLKERLHNAETENARLHGYLARVHEDDVVRDGFVEIQDESGKRYVPKRSHPLQQPPAGGSISDMLSSEYDTYGRPKKRSHWTGY